MFQYAPQLEVVPERGEPAFFNDVVYQHGPPVSDASSWHPARPIDPLSPSPSPAAVNEAPLTFDQGFPVINGIQLLPVQPPEVHLNPDNPLHNWNSAFTVQPASEQVTDDEPTSTTESETTTEASSNTQPTIPVDLPSVLEFLSQISNVAAATPAPTTTTTTTQTAVTDNSTTSSSTNSFNIPGLTQEEIESLEQLAKIFGIPFLNQLGKLPFS